MAEPQVGGGTSAALGTALLPRCPTDLKCETQKVQSSHSKGPTASRGPEEHGVTPPELQGLQKSRQQSPVPPWGQDPRCTLAGSVCFTPSEPSSSAVAQQLVQGAPGGFCLVHRHR